MFFFMVFYVFSELRLEVIGCFVDVCGIVDSHSLKLSFHNYCVLDSLLAKASFTDLSTAQTDHHGSMPDMSSSGKLKVKSCLI